MLRQPLIENPYRPGAGHQPPFLAGRQMEREQFERLLSQPVITENVLITGLRGIGKTVLFDQLRSKAEAAGWLWVGNDLAESSSISEERLALRILTDIAQAIGDRINRPAANSDISSLRQRLDQSFKPEEKGYTFDALRAHFEQSPGLPSDRLRAVLQRVSTLVRQLQMRGLVLGYDEAQCLCDHADRNEFPLSALLEVVSQLQKREAVTPCLLVLSGLPQVFDALIATRTYTERMFQVLRLERLSRDETRAAIVKPLSTLPVRLHTPPDLIEKAVDLSGGYPYLIQFFGRELVEQLLANGGTLSAERFPDPEAIHRLDTGLFSARWNRTTDRQRELLILIATRPRRGTRDFSVRELEQLRSDQLPAETLNFHQLVAGLCERGLLYRTRHGHYAFTVPMSEEMILRRLRTDQQVDDSWQMPETAARPAVPPQRDEVPRSEAASAAPRQRRRWFR